MDQLQKLIVKGKIPDALNLLGQQKPEHQLIIVQLLKQWEKLQRESMMGILSRDNENTERNQITAKILDLASQKTDNITIDSVPKAPQDSKPEESVVSSEITTYVSYAWGGDSETIVDKIETAFKQQNLPFKRDKESIGYRESLKKFMEALGRGNKVIVVVSKKYLESPNCMFELTQIYQNDNFRSRIYPVILNDAKIYSPVSRIKYIKYWDAKIKELDEAIKSIERGVNITEIQQELNQYETIRDSFDKLAAILKDMNALTPEMHQNENFDQLFT